MRRRTKYFIRKWSIRVLILLMIGILVLINVNRLQNNNFANYEKAIDFGEVRETKPNISPIIAVMFYIEERPVSKTISTYLNHAVNYKKDNIKMVIVPPATDENSYKFLQKFYSGIAQHNEFEQILLVGGKEDDLLTQEDIIKSSALSAGITQIIWKKYDITQENKIDGYLKKDKYLLVFISDVANYSPDDINSFLSDEAIFLAQNNSLKMQVFDAIDAQVEASAKNNYVDLFVLDKKNDEPLINRQQNNLYNYVEKYENEMLRYFKMNLFKPTDVAIALPQKNSQNYRLFDRGKILVQIFDAQNNEIFSKAKIKGNQAIIVSLAEIAKKAAQKITSKPQIWKIYLLTDFEPINEYSAASLLEHPEIGDGIYVKIGKKDIFILADENRQNIIDIWQNVINIRENNKIAQFYKFKTAEMKDEN